MDAKLRIKTALFFGVFLVGAPALAQTLQVSTNEVTLPITGGGTSTQISLTSSTSTPVSFTVGPQTASWFSVSPSSGTTPTTLTVNLVSAPLAATSGTFTLRVASVDVQTITVKYVPGGGGTPSGAIQAQPSQLTPNLSLGGSVDSVVSLTTANTALISFTASVTAAPGVPIFASIFATSGVVSASTPGSITVRSDANVAGIAANGTYINTVTLTPTGGGQTTSIPVTLTVGAGGSGGSFIVSPANISFSYPSGTLSQNVTVSSINAAVTTFTATASSSNGWLVLNNGLSQVSLSVGSGLTVSVNSVAAAQLPSGTVTGTVTIANPVNATDFATITVNLGVNIGTLPALTITPASIALSSPVNGPQLSTPISLTTTAGTTSFFISGVTGSWLTASANTTTLPATLTITAIPSGLAANTYNGSVSLTFSGGVTGTQSIPVSLIVGGSGTGTGSVGPTALNFAYQLNSETLVPQQVVSVAGTGAISVTVTTSGNQPWLAASGTATAPGNVVVYVIPAALGVGDYTGSVTITTSSGTSNVLVTLKITSGAVLNANPPTINVNNQQFNTNVSLTASDNSTQAFSASSSASWVTVSSASGSTPGTFSVSVNPAGLPNGVTTANITVTAAGASNNPLIVPVVALVSGSTGGGGTVTANPTSLEFSHQAGGTAPAAKTLSLTSAAGSSGVTATVSFSTSSGGNWLSTGIASGATITTPRDLSITVNPSGLAIGEYQGTITVTPTGGTAVQVPVKLTVTGQTISASTPSGTSLSYNYRAGDASPAAQSITVSGSGTFSATTQSTGNWLAVTPTSGTAPSTLNATVNPINLAAGTYNGTITVAGTGNATGSTTITVTLVVTAPLPTVSRVTNAASFVAGAISPGEIISIFGTAIGPTSAVGLMLDQNGRVSTSIGGVQVFVNGFLAPLTFASSTQINAAVPYEVKGQLTAQLWVRYLNQTSNVITAQVAATAPGLFTANNSGTGPAAVIYPNPTLATATRGDIIVLYGTGEGETNPAGVTGRVTPGTMPFTVPLLTPVVLIDGQPAQVIFFGEAPTYISGLLQLNVRIPDNARSGDLPVVLRIGGADSQPNVTISVR